MGDDRHVAKIVAYGHGTEATLLRMRHPLALLAGALAIPALIGAMELLGSDHETGRVEYEHMAFTLPTDWEYDRERDLQAQLPDDRGVFRFTPQDLAGQLDLPPEPEFDRRVEVDGRTGRDIGFVQGGQYTRLVVLDGGGVFLLSTPVDARAGGDAAFDEIVRSADVH